MCVGEEEHGGMGGERGRKEQTHVSEYRGVGVTGRYVPSGRNGETEKRGMGEGW